MCFSYYLDLRQKSEGFKTLCLPPFQVSLIAINNDWFKAGKMLQTFHTVDLFLVLSKILLSFV